MRTRWIACVRAVAWSTVAVAAVVACGSAPDDPAVGGIEHKVGVLDRPLQPGEKGCGPKIVCDDGNPCTADSCVRGTGCVFTPLTGTACNDGNACTQTDTCEAGVCTGSNPIVCTAEDACHGAGTCNPATGTCSNPTAPDGTTCDDGNACTQSDACSAGLCTGSNPVVCSALDACHVAGTCDPTSGRCSNPDAAAGTVCDDGNACTFGDACDGGGVCAGSLVSCVSDACNVRSCNGTSICTVTPSPEPGYYLASDGSCTACGCNTGHCVQATGSCYAAGAQSSACDATGACTCLPGFTGAMCDQLVASWDLAVESTTVTMIWQQTLGEDQWIIPVPLENLGQNSVSAWTSCLMGGAYFAPSVAATLQPGTYLALNPNQALFTGPRSAMPAGSPQTATCSITSFITPGANDQNTANDSAQVTVVFPDAPTRPSQADIAVLVAAPFECSSLVSLDSYQYSPPVAGQAVCVNVYTDVSGVGPTWQLSCTVDGVTQNITGPSGSLSFYQEFNFGVLGAGTHTLSCTGDSGNVVIENNKENNTLSSTFTL